MLRICSFHFAGWVFLWGLRFRDIEFIPPSFYNWQKHYFTFVTYVHYKKYFSKYIFAFKFLILVACYLHVQKIQSFLLLLYIVWSFISSCLTRKLIKYSKNSLYCTVALWDTIFEEHAAAGIVRMSHFLIYDISRWDLTYFIPTNHTVDWNNARAMIHWKPTKTPLYGSKRNWFKILLHIKITFIWLPLILKEY